MPDAVVEVTDDAVVQIDLPEETVESLRDKDETKKAEARAKPEPKVSETSASGQSAADEAAAQLAEAKRSADESRRRAESAEQIANSERQQRDAAQRDAQALRERANQGDLTILDGKIESAQRELAAAKQEYRRAIEAGEFDKQTDAQERMSVATSEIALQKDKKAAFEAGATRQQTHEGRVSPPVDHREAWIGQLAPRAQKWMRDHNDCVPPEVGGDRAKNAKMMAGHWSAKGQGYAEGSDDYFRVIEEALGERGTPAVDPEPTPVSAAAKTTPAAPARQQSPRPQPSAPVSREPRSADGTGGPRREVRLSPQQQEAAKISFPHLTDRAAFTEYAKNLVALEAEGKMGRTSH